MVKKVSIWLTLEPLLYSRPIHLAEISRKLKMNHVTVMKRLRIFEKLGIIKKERIGKQTFYSIKNSPLLVDYLTIVEKERLIEKCKRDLIIREVVSFFHKFDNPIIIFGSSVLSTKKANDIDILIVGRFKGDVERIQKKLNIKIQIINVSHLRNVNNALKKEIIKKHIIVQGSEEVIKWMVN